jgi:hypothetical protein
MPTIGSGWSSGADRRAGFRLSRCWRLFVVGVVSLSLGASSAGPRAVAATAIGGSDSGLAARSKRVRTRVHFHGSFR